MKNLFFQFRKANEERREIAGVMIAEVADKDGEVFDYQSSVPFFKAWSAQFEKATRGRSLGNVREMHQNKAVGKLTHIDYDGQAKSIAVVAKIVDADAWKLCKEGVYTGFSIGGSYVESWRDGQFTRYTAMPSEVSIVDNPCVPVALFEYVKQDGSVSMVKLVGGVSNLLRRQAADPPASLQRNSAAPPAGTPIVKSMYDVGTLATMLNSIKCLQQSCAAEAQMEGDSDGAALAERLRLWLKDGVEILKQMVEEEGSELTGGDDETSEAESSDSQPESQDKSESQAASNNDVSTDSDEGDDAGAAGQPASKPPVRAISTSTLSRSKPAIVSSPPIMPNSSATSPRFTLHWKSCWRSRCPPRPARPRSPSAKNKMAAPTMSTTPSRAPSSI